jgi:hypothetical protein
VRIDVDALPPTGGDLRWLAAARVLRGVKK